MASEPTALARMYRNSETNLSVAFAAMLDVEGLRREGEQEVAVGRSKLSLRSAPDISLS